jgi:hypothetical protein
VRGVRGRLMAALRPYVVRRRAVNAAAGVLVGLALAGLIAGVGALVFGRTILGDPMLLAACGLAVALSGLARVVMPVRALEAALAIEHAFPFLQDRVATAVDLLTSEPRRVPRSEAATIRVAEEATAALDDLPITRAVPVRGMRTSALIATLGLGLAALAWSAAPLERMPRSAPAIPRTISDAPETAAPEPPRIFDLTVTIEPPRYSGLPRRTHTDDMQTIRALAGSTVTIGGTCSLAEAQVSLETGSRSTGLAAAPGGRMSHSFTLREAMRWRLSATADSGATATAWRTIEPTEDAPPTVRLLRPDGDVTLAVSEPVEISVAAGDDFGVSALGLHLRLVGETARPQRSGGQEGPLPPDEPGGWRSMPLQFTPGPTASATVRLNPAGVGLRPGGELIVRAWATDNDAASGPKTSHSAPVRIRLETPAGLRRSEPETPIEQARREEADAMEQLQRTARELQRQLSEAIEGAMRGHSGEGREMPGRPGMELQEAARRLQEQAGRLEQAMRRAEEQLTSQQQLSPELVEKVRELHELMRDVLDEEMRRALAELQRAVEAQSPEQMRLSLEAAREAQERFMQRLEQTMSLLKRARMEALLGELRAQAEQLAKRQGELSARREKLSDGRSQQSREAERDQRLLARDTEPLADRVDAAVEQARDLSGDLAVKIGAIADRLRREDPSGEMRRAASALERGSPAGAEGAQQTAERSLKQAAADLGELEQQLASDFTAEARREIAEMLRDTLSLSQSQERLRDDVQDLGRRSRTDLLRDKRPISPLSRRQRTLTHATRALARRMGELAQKTPAMSPMMAGVTEVIADEMAQSGREIDGADLSSALARGRDVIAGLNELAKRLLETDEQLSQQSAQSTLQQYMERLKSLADRQQGLNEQTGEAQQGESGERRPGEGAGMSLSQMGYEQALIRRALRQMLQEGRAGEATGSVADQLGGVPDEMEKVEGDLRSGRIQRETVERQERILEKMLEAQRSLYTRDEERSERKAERPSAFEPPPSPPALSPGLMSRQTLEVGRGRGVQALPRGYEDLVREYYRRLGEEPPR